MPPLLGCVCVCGRRCSGVTGVGILAFRKFAFFPPGIKNVITQLLVDALCACPPPQHAVLPCTGRT